MRAISIPLLIIVCIFSSCASSTYFLSSLASENENVKQVENGDFIAETEDLWIAHNFNGRGTSMQITVFNKSDIPLYVDWQRSFLVIDGRNYSYASSRMAKDGRSIIRPILFDAHGELLEMDEATELLPTHISYIPPETMITLSAFQLSQINFDIIPRKGYKKQTMLLGKRYTANVKKIEYTEEESPMRLQSNLSVYTADEASSSFEQSFYLKNIVKSKGLKPKALPKDLALRGDLLYLEQPVNNKVMKILAKGATIIGISILDIAISTSLDSEFGFLSNYLDYTD